MATVALAGGSSTGASFCPDLESGAHSRRISNFFSDKLRHRQDMMGFDNRCSARIALGKRLNRVISV